MDTTSAEDAARKAAQPGIFNKVADSVVEKALSHAGAQMVFGDPVREEHRTVVPVAHVTYRFGFGAGEGQADSTDNKPSGGGGGGGGGGNLTARPIGFIETTADGSQFVPITDVSQIARTAITVFGMVAIVLALAFKASRGSND